MRSTASPFWGRKRSRQAFWWFEFGGHKMRAIRNAIVSCSVITALIISQPAMAATSYDAQPAPTEAQSVTWDHGIALFQSSQPNSQLGVKFLEYDGAKLFFLLSLTNRSADPIDFGPGQITFNLPDGGAVKLYSKDELIEAIKRKRATKRFFGILGATIGVLGSVAASQQTRSGTRRDRDGRSYSYIERSTNGAILAVGTAASVGLGAAVLKSANKNANEKIFYLNENYITKQTIPVTGELVGVIAVQMPKVTATGGSVEMTVNVAGDTHAMKFNIVKR